MQPRQTRRVFGALTLGIIKVRRNGDNDTIQLACQGFSCPRRQCFEDVRRNALDARWHKFNDGASRGLGEFKSEKHYYRPIPQAFLDTAV